MEDRTIMNIARPVTLITFFFASCVPALQAQTGSGTLRLLDQEQIGGSVSSGVHKPEWARRHEKHPVWVSS